MAADTASVFSPAFVEKCKRVRCRISGEVGVEPVVDLGMMPHINALLTREQLDKIRSGEVKEPMWPLELIFAPESKLVQITETVDPSIIFGADYPYFSSFMDAWLAHCKNHAKHLIQSRGLNTSSLVIELASNDGYMLKNFVEAGVPALGIDPAPEPCKAAEKIGVPTMCAFFGVDLAQKLVDQGKLADVVIGNNVMAHVADTNGFVKGMGMLLKDDGTTSVENPYLRDFIEKCEFDTIYHEHLCYYSATSVTYMFEKNGLYLNHVERIPTHGGSLRYYGGKKKNLQDSVKNILAEERDLGMDKPGYYRGFAQRVHGIRETMRSLIADIRRQGKTVAAYGAAAKGAVMLNFLGADHTQIDFCVDKNPFKQNKFMPGVHVPILHQDELLKRKPDYCIILPWNFKEEIMQQQAEYRKQGGRFIVPIPSPVIV